MKEASQKLKADKIFAARAPFVNSIRLTTLTRVA